MQLTLNKDWIASDFTKEPPNNRVAVRKGTHEVERVKNPRGGKEPLIVLKGTMTGAVLSYWTQYNDGDDPSKHVTITPGPRRKKTQAKDT